MSSEKQQLLPSSKDSLLSRGSHHTDYGSGHTADEQELAAVEPVTIAWRNLNVRVSAKKGAGRVLLSDVNGVCKPGQLMALMGASGAGKTTLLNTLLQRNLKGLCVSGEVLCNGHELGREITACSGYAQQEELFVGTLTVSEYLHIQANLRLRASAEERRRRVSVVLRQLGLHKCAHTRIGIVGVKKGISGGEARRLTFACEMLSNPSVLFADEPTTGLDSFMAEAVVKVLSHLAHSGRTVICTIHQPASQLFAMFDSVMLLAGGRAAFLGSPQQSLSFFAAQGHPCPHNYNPADLIIHTLAVVPGEEAACHERIHSLCNAYKDSDDGKQVLDELRGITPGKRPAKRVQSSLWVQLSALLYRGLLDNWRNPSLTRAKMIQKSVMGLFLGLLYFQTPLHTIGINNLNGALFYLVAELTYSTLFGILTFMPSEYPLLVREHHDGLYGVAAYYFTRSLSYLPLFSLDGLFMLMISYWMVGFSSGFSQVLLAILSCFLIEQCAASFGMMLSTVSPSYPVAVSLAGPLLTLLSLTGGLYANVGALPAYISWIQYLSWFRYGFEALAINQWSRVDGPFQELIEATNTTQLVPWTDARRDNVLNAFSFDYHNLSFDMFMMVVLIALFYSIGLVGLKLRVIRSR